MVDQESIRPLARSAAATAKAAGMARQILKNVGTVPSGGSRRRRRQAPNESADEENLGRRQGRSGAHFERVE
jgi:hypothetical protein